MKSYAPLAGNEKQVVASNMRNMLDWANIEYQKYKATGETVFLQQAGEKLFNSVELYLSYVSNTRFYSHGAAYQVVQEQSLLDLFTDANHLHRFFYNAENAMSAQQAERIFTKVREKIRYRIGRLKK